MLILSRKRGQSIMIGDDVEIHVVDIGGGKVRLGITGPAWVPVHQRERYEAKRRQPAPRMGRDRTEPWSGEGRPRQPSALLRE